MKLNKLYKVIKLINDSFRIHTQKCVTAKLVLSLRVCLCVYTQDLKINQFKNVSQLSICEQRFLNSMIMNESFKSNIL